MSVLPEDLIRWLLSGDPSVRWQCMRDLLQAPEREYTPERMKISSEGWGSRLLGLQDPGGTWAGRLYTPKWTSTTYTMLELKRMGLDPMDASARRACRLLLEEGFYGDGGINFFSTLKHGETCVTAMILSLACYFQLEDGRIGEMARFLLKERMDDGGWNCWSFQGDTHSSFHTTISVLEGLREYEKRYDDLTGEIRQTRQGAIEFLSVHRFYKSHRTGKVVDPRMTRFPFPPRWRYDVMRCFDFLQEVDAPWNEGMVDAVRVIMDKRRADGTWPVHARYPGQVWFDMETRGQPSRWNTLRGARILQWLQKAGPGGFFSRFL